MIVVFNAHAQSPSDSSVIGDLIEHAFDVSEPLDGAVQLVEELENLARERLDLNKATASQLARIPGFDRLSVTQVLQHRKKHGPFESVDDLHLVEGIPEDLIDGIKPFLYVPSNVGIQSAKRGASLEILQRIGSRISEEAASKSGESSGAFAGQSVYTRLRGGVRGRWTFNLTMEKDAGEVFVWDHRSHRLGYDHVSSYISLEGSGVFRQLVVGDFTVNAGQGLTLWRNGSFGKGRDPVRLIARNGAGIVPYGSTDENQFFRGVAATAAVSDRFAVSVFASRRRLDAVVKEVEPTPDTDAQRIVSSFPLTGYHRTQTELDHRDAVRESLVGSVATMEFGAGRAGITGYHTVFSLPVMLHELYPGKYALSGDRHTAISFFTDYVLGDLHFFGEVGTGSASTPSGLVGFQYRVPLLLDLIIHLRHYPHTLNSLHGHPFSSQSSARNETGYYTGFRLTPSRSWTFSGYFDQYTFPWLRSQVPQPSNGYETFVSATYAPRKWLSVYLHGTTKAYANAHHTVDAAGRHVRNVVTDHRSVFRAQVDYAHSNRLDLRTRMDVTRYLSAEEDRLYYGLLLFQEIRYTHSRFSLSTRYAIFDSDSYGARLYMHERDLLNVLSFPVLTGAGDRYYVLLSYGVTSKLKVQLKWAETRTSLSPNERIHRKEIRMMVQART